MTAINIFRQRNAVHILSDGAGIVGDRIVLGAAKVIALPHLRAAVTIRGARLLQVADAKNLTETVGG